MSVDNERADAVLAGLPLEAQVNCLLRVIINGRQVNRALDQLFQVIAAIGLVSTRPAKVALAEAMRDVADNIERGEVLK